MLKKIKILSTSDVHGFIYPTDYSSPDKTTPLGLLKAGSLISRIKDQSQPDELVLAVENGDLIQGSPLTSYLADHPQSDQSFLTKITSKIGYQAGILGNHEFNFGLEFLRHAESQRNYPLLGANLHGHDRTGISDQPYQIIEEQGVKIVILGLTTAFVPNWEAPKNLGDLQFESILSTAARLLPSLRSLADVVIVAYHGGFEADLTTGQATEPATTENEGYRLLTSIPGIDALITGHQHRKLAGHLNGVPYTQPGLHGTYVGEIELTLDQAHHVVSSTSQLLPTANEPLDPNIMPSSALEDQVQGWLSQSLGEHVGASMRIADPLTARQHGHPYLTFVNQVQMDAVDTDIAATALFNDELNGFPTKLTLRDIFNNYPYPNLAVAELVTGRELRQALEQCASFFQINCGQLQINPKFCEPKPQLFNYDLYTGINYEFDIRKPIGHRVTYLTYHEKAVTEEQQLIVAMNNYRAIGGGNYPMFASSKIQRQSQKTIPNLMIDYLKNHQPYQAQSPHNFSLKF
ncbi:2', 3'-cyclic-nucleotide 2'-phosphodiesterase [Fructilactobacillus florum 8D]|uniref:2', 3'-cyclic-nucleotide 2'-phosphodiesterase n=1 Tax=Fructilactobacillus florum 8D TaxID=1221538 RepID=W9EIG3_9LACO|nr:bifunctional metallophosphatase/5'-nucleotidase [Fructilactobacillus florum]EKK20370.1 2', 3'-cyclic-nucleotide 2'-phosphodiesterase [Fructilactobacillus florum 2F]ETO41066.1 2', 3'-cyclic-nucleotide 2'-phosphodiesterase [Fructilactobacillus florum 8D]